MMELAELLGLLQYEVQKSYDFAAQLARVDATPGTSVLQLALERVELDLPISVAEADRAFNRADEEIRQLPAFAKRFRIPFAPDRLSHLRKGAIPKGKVTGRTLDVQVIGEVEKIDETRKGESIARLRVVLKPVMK